MSMKFSPPTSWYRSSAAIKTGIVVAFVLVALGVISQSSSTSWPAKTPWPTSSGLPAWRTEKKVDLMDHIANETLGFQKIFAITMPLRVDQRDALSLAGVVTGLQVDLLDGVTDLDTKALPPGGEGYQPDDKWIKAWRAHLDTLRMIVRENITTALILEGDVDWDLRVKAQMRDFAKASQLLTQPRLETQDQFVDPTWPKSYPGASHSNFDISEQWTEKPKISPYGDKWDVLWLGHCGTKFPSGDDKESTPPTGRVMIPNDETVPAHKYMEQQFGNDDIKEQYPQYTRVVHRARENVCSLAYAVSQQGARRILYEMSIRKIDAAFDLMLREYCDGLEGRKMRVCLSVQPTYFAQHRRAGLNKALTDIGEGSEGYNELAFTRNVRRSVQTNLQKILDGETDYIDWPREERDD